MEVTFTQFIKLKHNLKPNTTVKVLSDSMSPYIHTHDLIKVSPLQSESIDIGEVIVFWRDNKLICHILIRKHPDSYYQTMGLSSSKIDPKIHINNILGIVTSPRVGKCKKLIFRSILFVKFYRRRLFKGKR